MTRKKGCWPSAMCRSAGPSSARISLRPFVPSTASTRSAAWSATDWRQLSRLRWKRANTSTPLSCEACEGAMSDLQALPTRPAADGFDSYYTEKLWEWIPEVYRDLDGEADNPGQGTLRALVELIAGQAA